MTEKLKHIVILATASETTNMVVNALAQEFEIARVIIEDRIPKRQFWARRLKRLGWSTVLGQILFGLLIVPILNWQAKDRLQVLKSHLSLNDKPFDSDLCTRVTSVNSEETRLLLQQLQPALIVVKGTRIISKKTLSCVPVRFINMHAGITPRYRGVHGAYWALVENKPEACGITIHLVDSGIDTGGVLEQGIIQPAVKDNFVTYPLLQLAVGLPLLEKAIRKELDGKLTIKEPLTKLPSKLWYHPTFWGYFWSRWRFGVK